MMAARLLQLCSNVEVVWPVVGGLGDGQGTLGRRPPPLRLAQMRHQDRGA